MTSFLRKTLSSLVIVLTSILLFYGTLRLLIVILTKIPIDFEILVFNPFLMIIFIFVFFSVAFVSLFFCLNRLFNNGPFWAVFTSSLVIPALFFFYFRIIATSLFFLSEILSIVLCIVLTLSCWMFYRKVLLNTNQESTSQN